MWRLREEMRGKWVECGQTELVRFVKNPFSLESCPSATRLVSLAYLDSHQLLSMSLTSPHHLIFILFCLFIISICLADDENSPLQVHFIIHSHQDPGWLMTFDEYTYKTRKTYDIFRTIKYPFVYQEMSYLKNAVDIMGMEKETMERMELVGSGWTLTDEACPTYSDYLRNMHTGHQYAKALINHVGANPRKPIQTLWNIDPFGHSRTISLEMALAMGMKYVVLNRIDRRLKFQWREQQHLQFQWCKAESECVLVHVLQDHYSAPKGFHFDGDGGEDYWLDEATHAESLIKAIKEQANYFKTKQLLVPYGDDFTHTSTKSIENLEKVLAEIRNNPEKPEYSGVEFRFSTLSEYFEALEKELQEKKIDLPTLYTAQQDFFPYTATDPGSPNPRYWTGYFTSHPTFKRFVRESSNFLRTAELMASFHIIQDAQKDTTWHDKKTELDVLTTSLLNLDREVSLDQHHDAITGTSKKHVRRDFQERMQKVLKDAKEKVLQSSLSVLIQDTEKMTIRVLDAGESIDVKEGGLIPLIVLNNLDYARSDFCSVHVSTNKVKLYALDTKGQVEIPFDILPGELLFLANDIPALGFKTLFLEYDAESTKGPVEPKEVIDATFALENQFVKLEFADKTLKSMAIRAASTETFGDAVNVAHKLMVYHVDQPKEGAYIFFSFDPAEEAKFIPSITISQGTLVSEVRLHDSNGEIGKGVKTPLTIVYRVYHTNHLDLGQFVEVAVVSDVTAVRPQNNDLVSRFDTQLSSDTKFFTDANGYSILERTRNPEKSISANYFPATQCAWIKDESHQFSLLLHQAHGVSSQKNGSLEVMIARATSTDDGKGVDERLQQDTRPSTARFRFMLHSSQIDEHTVTRMAREFDHKFLVASHNEEEIQSAKQYQTKHTTLFSPLNFTDSSLYVLTFAPLLPIHFDQQESATHREEHSHFIIRLQNLDRKQVKQDVNLLQLFNLPNRSVQNVTEWTATLLQQKESHFDPTKLSFSPNEIRTFTVQFEDTTPPPQPTPTDDLNAGGSIFAYLLGVLLAICFMVATIVLIIFFIIGSMRRGWMQKSTQNWIKLDHDTLNDEMDSADEIEKLQLDDSEDDTGAAV